MKRHKDYGVVWTISPVAIWMTVLFAIPLLLILVVSFMSRSSFGGIQTPFTADNYVRFFDPLYLKILWVSCVSAFITTVCCLVLGYPFAYIVARAPERWRNLLLMLVIVPFWTNSLIRTYAWIVLLRTEGVINTFLLKLGLIDAPISMLYNETSVVIGLVYTMLPFMILPLYASIEKLDKAYLEAAADLGAKPATTFLKITLPLTMPGIVAGAILVFIPSLGLFFIPDLMGGSKAVLIGNLIKNQFLTARDWPFGAASSIILMVLTLLMILVYMRLSNDKSGKELR
ncbi:spermidine/putrescine ABC transporter permease PotB [Brevibacillus fluminis]|uniref:spermidine/putrescine ABC transporter permease PotB n=1 Tax=Brevibacillus fluminis TaxID=511487 RepID=UPI003F893D40